MTKNENANSLIPATPISHWQWTTFRDIVTGDIHRQAEQLKTTPLRAANAQTLTALFRKGWLSITKDEDLQPTDLGLREFEFWQKHEGRYRKKDYGISENMVKVTTEWYQRKRGNLRTMRKSA